MLKTKRIVESLVLAAAIAGLVACGGGDGSSALSTVPPATVGGAAVKGPVSGGTVTITDANGTVIGTGTTGSNGSFELNLPANTAYPVTLTLPAGGAAVDTITGQPLDMPLQAIVFQGQTTVQLSVYSTIIAKLALELVAQNNNTPTGDASVPSQAQLATASSNLIAAYGLGLPALGADGGAYNPVTEPLTAANAEAFIIANEVLAEIIRRTTAADTGSASNDVTMTRIAHDLLDGTLDGAGGTDANNNTFVIAQTMTGQVMMEALGGALQVAGNTLDATTDGGSANTGGNTSESLASAINRVLGTTTAAPAAAALPPTTAVLTQAKQSIDFANTLQGGSIPSLTQLSTDLQTAITGSTPNDTASAATATTFGSTGFYPAGTQSAIGNSVTASTSYALAIAPVVNPAATEGILFSLTPTVTSTVSGGGGTLTFSVSNPPSWAPTINTATGNLSGTPGFDQVKNPNASGVVAGVSITVTDGITTVTEGPFDITVFNVNQSPVISGTQSLSNPATTPSIPVPANPQALTAQVGQTFQIQATATDADSEDTLVFSVAGNGAYGSINATTGLFTGLLTSVQQSSPPTNIVISVSDQQGGTDSLPAFSITLGGFLMTWDAATDPRVDGYRVYFGSTTPLTKANADGFRDVAAGPSPSFGFEFKDLYAVGTEPPTVYLAVASTAKGAESPLSVELSKP